MRDASWNGNNVQNIVIVVLYRETLHRCLCIAYGCKNGKKCSAVSLVPLSNKFHACSDRIVRCRCKFAIHTHIDILCALHVFSPVTPFLSSVSFDLSHCLACTSPCRWFHFVILFSLLHSFHGSIMCNCYANYCILNEKQKNKKTEWHSHKNTNCIRKRSNNLIFIVNFHWSKLSSLQFIWIGVKARDCVWFLYWLIVLADILLTA